MEKETDKLIDKLNDIGSLVISEDFETAKLLIKDFPDTNNKKAIYLLNLVKGVIELKEGNYYDSLKYLDAALNSPVLDGQAEQISYINGLLHRSTVNEKINHKDQQNADVMRAIDYAIESKLLKITTVRDKFTEIVKASPILSLSEDTVNHLRETLEPYSIIDVALSIKKNTIW